MIAVNVQVFKVFSGFALVFFALSQSAIANDGNSAGYMWGTGNAGISVEGGVESSTAHANNGLSAAQVNAAELGLLVSTGGTGTISIQTIGSQSVVSISIIGDNNDVDNQADQNSDNSGDVKNDGDINYTGGN